MITPSGPTGRLSLRSRFLGAWWGLFIGDAMGVPTDGYYNLKKLREHYPDLSGYRRPKEPHPNSEIHRMPVSPASEGDFLHHRRALWTKPGTHYHHGLEAGDITISGTLVLELADSLATNRRFDRADWVERYARILLKPEGHRDFYIPSAHRAFTANLLKGLPVEKCGQTDSHIAGIVEAAPILFFRANNADLLHRDIVAQINVVRPCPGLVGAAALFGEIFRLVLGGLTLDDACFKKLTHHHHSYLAFPYHRWIDNHTDEDIATRLLSQGPATDDGVPLALYVALKYSSDFLGACEVNALLGGDTCRRGSLVGMLLGAIHGDTGIPANLIRELTAHERIAASGEALWTALSTKA